MLLTPRPGVGLDDLIQTLDSTRTEAFNLRGGGGAHTAHKRLLAYLEWAGRAARMLRGRISDKDLASLVFNRRYELLLASAGTLTSSDVEVQRVVNDLVSQELDQRVHDFDEAIKTLKAYKERWRNVGDLLVLDTCFYVEHPDELPDADLAGLTAATTPGWAMHVLVPLLVVDELDRLKRDNQARSRARTALKTLDEVFRNVSEERPMGRLRDGNSSGLGPVTMELLFDPPDHERLPDNDAEIVDRALAVQILSGREVTMVTYDKSMALRARHQGLKDLWLSHPPAPQPTGQAQTSRSRRAGSPGSPASAKPVGAGRPPG